MTHTVKGSGVRKGMLVKSRLGVRLIVDDASDAWWSVRRARKDWLPDTRCMGWSAHLDPNSEWEVCGWRTEPPRVNQ